MGFTKFSLEISHDFFVCRCRPNILKNKGSAGINITTKNMNDF